MNSRSSTLPVLSSLSLNTPWFFVASARAPCSTADITSQPRLVAMCPGCSEAGIHHQGTGARAVDAVERQFQLRPVGRVPEREEAAAGLGALFDEPLD